MNENELTKVCNDILQRVKELESMVHFLDEENERQRLLLDEIDLDVQTLQGRRRDHD